MRLSKSRGFRGWLLVACLLRLAMRASPEIWHPSLDRASNPIPATASAARYFVGRSVSAALLFRFCLATWTVYSASGGSWEGQFAVSAPCDIMRSQAVLQLASVRSRDIDMRGNYRVNDTPY